MRRALIGIQVIALFWFLSCDSLSDSASEDYFDPNKRNHLWCYYEDDGSDGGYWIPAGGDWQVPDGKYTLFYANGNMRQRGRIKSNVNVDTIHHYDTSGNFSFYQIITGDSTIYLRKDGLCVEYYAYGGIKSRRFYLNNQLHGKSQTYYENGNVKGAVTYSHGKPEGVWFWYDEVGNIKRESHWLNGLEHGENIEYREDRSVKHNQYVNGRINGESITYYTNKKVQRKLMYQDGVLHGVQETYYKNGQLKHRDHYVDGKKEGLEWSYNSKGVLTFEGRVKDGIALWYKEYDDEGKLQEEWDGTTTISY